MMINDRLRSKILTEFRKIWESIPIQENPKIAYKLESLISQKLVYIYDFSGFVGALGYLYVFLYVFCDFFC